MAIRPSRHQNLAGSRIDVIVEPSSGSVAPGFCWSSESINTIASLSVYEPSLDCGLMTKIAREMDDSNKFVSCGNVLKNHVREPCGPVLSGWVLGEPVLGANRSAANATWGKDGLVVGLSVEPPKG